MQQHPLGRTTAVRDEHGAVAVEFALVLPLLIILLVGTITGGIAFSHALGLQNAVREGARFGATADVSAGTWTDDVIRRVRQTQFDDGTDASSSSTTVCVEVVGDVSIGPTCSGAAVNAPATPAFTGTAPVPETGTCVVKVWAARHFKVTLGVFPEIEGDMVRQSASRYERPC